MRLQIGSLQQKSGRWYLVQRIDGKQRWMALKTSDRLEARRRARILVSPQQDEISWLIHLEELGDRARRIRMSETSDETLSWDRVRNFRLGGGIAPDTEQDGSHRRWLSLLGEIAEESNMPQPSNLTPVDADSIVAKLSQRYVSARRMISFFGRVWRELGLDASIWKTRVMPGSTPAREYYRRLGLEEIRRVYTRLKTRYPAIADVVLVGYATGLRLSDVVELDLDECDPTARFLRLVPNKTRHVKFRPIAIPLVPFAQRVIAARMIRVRNIRRNEDGMSGRLFPEMTARMVGRHFREALDACGIVKIGDGRASFHSLRATFISMMDEAGIPPHITDAITGHAGGGMHARYTQPSSKTLLTAVTRAIPPLEISTENDEAVTW